MKREFLKDLGLEKDAIDKIMAEYGKGLTAEQTKTGNLEKSVEALTTERDTLADNNKTLNASLEELKGQAGNSEELQAKITEMQTAHEKATSDLKSKLDAQEYSHMVDNFLNGYQFNSDFTKKGVKAEMISKGFKVDGDKLLGADDYMKDFKENNPTLFNTEVQPQYATTGSGQTDDDNSSVGKFDDLNRIMGVSQSKK